jgi:hypothetical protein
MGQGAIVLGNRFGQRGYQPPVDIGIAVAQGGGNLWLGWSPANATHASRKIGRNQDAAEPCTFSNLFVVSQAAVALQRSEAVHMNAVALELEASPCTVEPTFSTGPPACNISTQFRQVSLGLVLLVVHLGCAVDMELLQVVLFSEVTEEDSNCTRWVPTAILDVATRLEQPGSFQIGFLPGVSRARVVLSEPSFGLHASPVLVPSTKPATNPGTNPGTIPGTKPATIPGTMPGAATTPISSSDVGSAASASGPGSTTPISSPAPVPGGGSRSGSSSAPSSTAVAAGVAAALVVLGVALLLVWRQRWLREPKGRVGFQANMGAGNHAGTMPLRNMRVPLPREIRTEV